MEPRDLPLARRSRAYAQNLVFGGLLKAALALPYSRRLPIIGWIVSRVISPIAGWPKRIRANLAYAWPELPADQVEQIVRDVPNNAARALIEAYSGDEFKDHLRDIIPEGPGWAALEQARRDGRGVFLISGHFGNYDAIRAFVAMKYGAVGGLYRPHDNVYFNRHYVRAIGMTSQPIFERGRRGLAEMMKFVRGGNIMAMLPDQHFGHGAPLTFFGKTAYTALSAPEIALKYNALIVPCYGIRQPDGESFQLWFDEPIPHTTPEEMGQRLNDSLEAKVREYPGQWLWLHRRWKDKDGKSRA